MKPNDAPPRNDLISVTQGHEAARARLASRRNFVRGAVAGTSVALLGGLYVVSDRAWAEKLSKLTRSDGRPRLPPGQRPLKKLKPMGGMIGDSGKSRWKLRVYGEVEKPFEIDFRQLLAMPQLDTRLDVHCVTGWSLLDEQWQGVELQRLADQAKLLPTARHVIFEAAHGYTANVPLKRALKSGNMIAHRHAGRSLAAPHGAPVRAVVPDLYFWKSAKWLTGIRFVRRDRRGYWERRGYHNLGDPWLEQRYS